MTRALSVLIVLGTRPEAIKLFPVIAAMRADPRFRATVCVSGQHRELLDRVLAVAGIVPDHDLSLMRPGQSLDELAAALLPAIGRVIAAEAPDRVMVQGDTASAMCAAISAYHRRIPVDHVEAGLRSYDLLQPWPEEGNRRIISALASLHFAPTDAAAAALLAENVSPARVHVTGNTVIDALRAIAAVDRNVGDNGDDDDPVTTALGRFDHRRIIVVTCHRRENVGAALDRIAEALARIAARPDVALVCPLHPNPAIRTALTARLDALANVALIEPLDYPDFVRLLSSATLVLTDSGGVQEEAPALGKPALVLRETTERGEGITAGTARLVGTNSDRIVAETFALLDDPVAYAAMAQRHMPFGDGYAAARIVEIIAREAGEPAR
jgi:UDP-N-acetylglucosamine 2-epimerase (non-hydrolysing)